MPTSRAPVALRHERGVDRFLVRRGDEGHVQRGRAMLKDHPELKALIGPSHWSILLTVLVTSVQLLVAWRIGDLPWWVTPVVAYVLGAWLGHVAFVLIHEATHNLMAKRKIWNHVGGFVANLPLLVPSYGAFRKFHLLHHRNMGDYRADADLPSVAEAAWVGRSTVRKAMWLLFYPVVQLLRTRRFTRYALWDRLVVVNVAFVVLADAAILWFLGPWACLYLALSLFFSIGLHPLGARWIQEHYVFKEGQETYSCYSPAGLLQLNVGLHVEHHDIPYIAWPRLPRVRKIAPEYYDDLYSHRSWTALLFRFLFSPRVTLFTRVVRQESNVQRDLRPARAGSGAAAPV